MYDKRSSFMDNKYVKLHSLLRMLGALLAIVIFISMFITKMVVDRDFSDVFFDFSNGAFFGKEHVCSGNVMAFFGYLFVLLAGFAGLAFVFIDEIIGKNLTKNLSFVAGGLALFGSFFILLFAPIFRGINGRLFGNFVTTAAPIVFGILGLGVGAIQIAAPILEKKGL